MKVKRKPISCFLMLCLCITSILNFSAIAVYAEDSISTTVSIEDVIAGMADISQLSEASHRATTAVVISDGIYYLNGEYSGDYLRNSSSSPVAKSGTFSSLGTSIRWIITNVSGSFSIRSASDTTKYLAVPTSSTSSSSVQLVTVSGSTVPTECLWNISYAAGGGCLVQNVYNSRYLYSYGDTVYTTNTLGTSTSSYYDTRVWRIAELSYVSGRELSLNTTFHKCHLLNGYSANLKYRTSPDNAIWAKEDDFVFSGYSSSVITIDSDGIITPVAVGETTITCTHKVTDRVFTVNARVWPVKENLGSISHWADIESNFVGHWASSPTVYCEKLNTNGSFYFLNGMNSGISKWNTALETNISTTSSESSANIVAYGGTISELAALGYTLSSTTLGNTSWNYTYLGHYTYGNSVRLGAKITAAEICIQDKTGKTSDNYINTCTHELGHSLGFFGHTSSSSAIMYAFGHSGVTLKTAEINHLKQVYD